jgi:diaminopimelate epimerase
MGKINFIKMSGAGNDFIVFDKDIYPDLKLDSRIIKKLCDRRNGIGADGVITMTGKSSYDFSMEYFNADGSTGSLCGNGSRCAIKFAQETGRIKNRKAKFISNDMVYSGEILDSEKIKFFLNKPERIKLNFKIFVHNQVLNINFINTGSPHVVINVNDILKNPVEAESFYENPDEVPVIDIGKEIRYHKEFSPEGTNVNFIKVRKEKVIMRTYERGVEDETLACGTGAVAVAIISYLNYGIKPPINVLTRGGETLIVDFNYENKEFSKLALIGSAKIVFTGEIQDNIFFN